MTHPYSNRNVVPTAVLTRSRLVSLNAARPVPIVVTQSIVKSTWPVKHVVNKAHSPVRRPINQRTATKNSNFNKKVTTVKVNKVDVVQGNKGNVEKASAYWVWKPKCPRENNMYNVDLKNVVPSGGLTCLFTKTILDESNLWHRRLGYINFKSMNKLVKGNLVRGLPSKIFEHNHTCVAYQKGKQHKASCKFKPVSSISQPLQRESTNNNAGIKENLNAGKVMKETVFTQQYVLLPLWSTSSQDPQDTDDNVADAAFDVKENEMMFMDLRAEFQEFSFNSTNMVNAISAPVNAARPNPTNITNNFNTASPSVNVVSPNFGIAGKSSFVYPSKYPDDPDTPELEDIIYSDEEEDVGAEADLSNLETNIPVSPIPTTRGHTQEEGIDYDEVFAPVARIEAIQLFLAYASFMGFIVYQMDVKSAFLYETIIEEELCKAFKKLMKDEFQMSYMGEHIFFLGLQVKQKDDGIFISQDKYVAKILRKFGFIDVKSASTPIKTEKSLLKDPNGEDVDVNIYRYLKGKSHLGLWYPRDSPFNLVAYSDSDYAGASLDKKSTTGGYQFLGCRLISWQCKKQTVVATSSKQTASGKDLLNPLIAESLLKTIWYSLHHVDTMKNWLFQSKWLLQISNESPLLGVNTPRCDEESIKLKELIVFMLTVVAVKLMLLVKKVNDVVQLRALIDGKKVVVSEAIIRRDLHLDDADGVECLPNDEIFKELARMGYEKPPPKLTFYKAFFFTQWKFLIHTLVQCLSAKRTALDDITTHNTRYTSPTLIQKVFANMRRVRKGFSGVETPLFASMLVQPQPQAEEGVKIPIAPAPPSTTSAPSPTDLQDPTPTPHAIPPQDQPLTSHASPPQDQPTTSHESSIPLLNTLMETCATLSQKHLGFKKLRKVSTAQRVESSTNTVLGAQEDASKQRGKIEATDADEGITLVDVETDEEVVAMDAESQERLNQEDVNAASKGVTAVSAPELVSAVEPTIFDDEDVTMTMAQTLIKLKAEKAKFLNEQIAQKLHDEENIAGYKMEFFKGMTYDKVRPIFEREYKKVQTLFKPDNEVQEPKKKRVVDEILLQESFKKLRAAEVSGSESNQEIPSNDLKEMTDKDVQNMLDIVPVSEFKVEALQVKYPIIDWEIHTEGFDREDIVALWNLVKEKFSSAVPSEDKEKALWVELKRLFEPDADDVLWKIQRYMHALLTWKFYTDCGVHYVSSTRGHDIFMLKEKDYPFSNVVMILMLSGKL
nr:hypothetical protein [Tanacetum cinerariifolium]